MVVEHVGEFMFDNNFNGDEEISTWNNFASDLDGSR